MYKSNLDNCLKHFSGGIKSAMSKCADIGVSSIMDETPVRTGKLQENNKATARDFSVIFYNKTPYASYVEAGTYLQNGNPFMRRGLNNMLSNFTDIIFKALKI